MADAKKKSSKKTAKTALPTTVEELNTKLVEAQNDYQDVQRSNAAGELANPMVIRSQRREIARIKTAIAKLEKEAK